MDTARKVAIAGLALGLCGAAWADERILRAELELDAPLDEVWKAWTTEDGVRGFFAPPSIPEIRGQRTLVVLDFEPLGERRTRLRFTHTGWGRGKAWDEAYAYFDAAWNRVVLPRLVHRFARGPVDWNAELKLEAVSPTMRVTLEDAAR